MTPRWEPHLRFGVLVAGLALAVSGCVFSPKEKPPDACIGCNDGPAKSADELIQKLAVSYQRRQYPIFENLFPKAADSAPYLFVLSEPLPGGQMNWDVTEELRIHQRMFEPENPRPGDAPVPNDLWLTSISITLNRVSSEWEERTDLYATPAEPEGLDSDRWKAVGAEWHADIFFDTQSETDYRVDGKSYFVVVEDLSKNVGDERKFLIYRWEDLSTPAKPGVPAI
jgi:hypothetical protein